MFPNFTHFRKSLRIVSCYGPSSTQQDFSKTFIYMYKVSRAWFKYLMSLKRLVVAAILKLTYGYNVDYKSEDPLVKLLEQVGKEASDAS